VTTVGVRRSVLWWRLRLLDPWPLIAVGIAAVLAWLSLSRPMFVQLAAVVVLALPLLLSAKARVLFIVAGTILVFGPPELTDAKLLFLFGASVAVAGAFGQSRALVGTPAYMDLKPMLIGSFALLLVIAISLPVAQFNDVPGEDWLRDVAPYVLLAWSPLFAFDAHRAFGTAALERLLVLAGLITAASFMFRWYEARQITVGGLEPFALTSLLLVGALFALAFSRAIDGSRGRMIWLVLAAGVATIVGSTGTRTALVLLAAPPAIVLGTGDRFARRSFRFAFALPMAAALVAVGSQSLFKLLDADVEKVTNRFQLLLTSGRSSDQSYQDRVQEIHAAWGLFKTEPVFGVGPGHVIPWSNANGTRFENVFVDTPVGLLPDYGVVGALVVALFAGCFVASFRRMRRRAGRGTTTQLALIGFAAVVLAYSVLLVPFEDKGLAVGLVLLLGLALREASGGSPDGGSGGWAPPPAVSRD
jgi:O-antigen ligase